MTDESKDKVPPQQPAPETAPDNKSGKAGEDANPAWLPDRLKDARKAQQNKILKDLGFEKLDDLAAFVSKGRDAEKGQLSEVDRLKADLAKRETELNEARYAADSERNARQVEKIDSAIRQAATSARAEIPADVLTLLKAEEKIDLETILDEDGNVKADVVKTLIEDVRKARPNWFARVGVGSPSNGSGHAPEPDQQKRDQGAKALNNNLRRRF